jgi:hypothetical protein
MRTTVGDGERMRGMGENKRGGGGPGGGGRKVFAPVIGMLTTLGGSRGGGRLNG